MSCPICDHMGLAMSDPVALVVGSVFLGHAIGLEAFKENLCAEHRREYVLALMRCRLHVCPPTTDEAVG